MTDTTKIERVLNAEEWARVESLSTSERLAAVGDMFRAFTFGVDVPRAMAVLNATLPDSDPRKITREWIKHLREVAEDYEYRGIDPNPFDTLNAMADALESYLRPEQ